MKLIKISPKFKALFLTKIPNSDIYLRMLVQLGIVAALSAVIWFWGPLIWWKEAAPLATTEKRLYAILYLFLIWLLKILLVDFSMGNSTYHKDADIRKKLQALQNRFRGVLRFLKKTSINKQDLSTQLHQLPWYLLLGPANAGKTTLLGNSKVHFILKRQFQAQQIQNLPPSENCDWWVTRDVSIVDVPSTYLTLTPPVKTEKPGMYTALWQFFLRQIKKQRGKHGIKGIMIALPLPEIMKQGDPKKYQSQLQHLFLRIQEIQKIFSQPIPCYLIVTKCDLLPGFNEFFAESTDDEINQSWGLVLPPSKTNDKIDELFTVRFNTLIKKINQQLLWRLHQERNPMARPYIKDFPLQVERLKAFILDFIKKFSTSNISVMLQGVYLTSSIQTIPEVEENIIDSNNTAQRAIQIFKEPAAASRAYFTKQLISQGLIIPKDHSTPVKVSSPWKRRSAYAASFLIISLAAIMFGKDFEQSIKQSYAIHNTLSEYQLAIQLTQNPDEQLAKTLILLNSLQQTAKNPNFKLDLLHLLNFYSNKSKQKSNVVYQQVLQNILMPELNNYLGEYLKTPVNKSTELVYAALEAYLMFGDTGHFQADFISNIFQTILPKSMNSTDMTQLMSHVKLALKIHSQPLPLDNNLVQETRKYLVALPSFQLSYIILKNINNNNIENIINLGTSANNSAFVNHTVMNQIPQMFTAKAFSNILSQEIIIAAQESTKGNWILGNMFDVNNTNPDTTASLLQQLRDTYITSYIETWENLLGNVHLARPNNLVETDAIITNLIGNDSPLLQLLQTLYDNTYFQPITAFSPKLQNLGLLLDKTNHSNTLYQIFSGLQSLHQYLHAILIAENEQKAAFEAVSTRMQHSDNSDVITQLRLIAERSPEPVKNWLNKITNNSWRFLLQDATHYMDISWQEQIGHFYQTEIANHYPFSQNATQEVELNKFTDFFGNPGIMLSFYNQYLVPFIDTSTTDWRWKTLDNQKLPFSDNALHQLQNALRIHHMFFPNSDNRLSVQFALQPYLLGKEIKQVKLRINDKKIIDQHSGPYHSHLLSWPSNHETKMTSVQFTMLDQKMMNRDFPGAWGWFKLVNQSFISAFSTKKILLNLSENSYPVKYLLYTQGQLNPFLSSNLINLHLPQQLIGADKQHA